METIFPTNTGYAGFFLVGFRKDPTPQTERTGTVILKRTYDIAAHADPAQGSLTPSSTPQPIFLEDQPVDLVRNGDFETESLADWQPAAGVTVARIEEEGNHWLRVSGNANGEVVQTFTYPGQLPGRVFTLSVDARTDSGSADVTVRLRAAGLTICSESQSISTTASSLSATGTCPDGVTGSAVEVVLQMATDADRTVRYDNVAVQALRFEADLAPFKPLTDLIVLDYADVSGTASVSVNGDVWLQRAVGASGERDLFGWEPRANDDAPARRQDLAGTFSEDANAYPPEWPVVNTLRDPLPGDFQNEFFNGHRRDSATAALSGYLPPDAAIVIDRAGMGDEYAFTLGGEMVTARYFFYDGGPLPDREDCWAAQPIPMQLDTLVIEPEADRCYAVWRGVWNFDAHPDDAYRRLLVEAV